MLAQIGVPNGGQGMPLRTVFPGYGGHDGLRSYAHGIAEGKESEMDGEEKKLFEVSYEIKKLIKELESKDEKDKAQ